MQRQVITFQKHERKPQPQQKLGHYGPSLNLELVLLIPSRCRERSVMSRQSLSHYRHRPVLTIWIWCCLDNIFADRELNSRMWEAYVGRLVQIVVDCTRQIFWRVCRLIWSFAVSTKTGNLSSGLKAWSRCEVVHSVWTFISSMWQEYQAQYVHK